jgi:hypothetical protein
MKTKKATTARFTLRVPNTVKSALAKQARKQGRSINAQAVLLIQGGLNQSAA